MIVTYKVTGDIWIELNSNTNMHFSNMAMLSILIYFINK